MNDLELAQFETELKSLRPEKMPEEIGERVLRQTQRAPRALPPRRFWNRPGYLSWLAPATAAAALAGILFSYFAAPPKHHKAAAPIASAVPPLKADSIEIDRQLLADFYAVARLPDGEPVRFRCSQWMDRVRVRDSAAGLLIERSSPRLEIIPIGVETD